MPMNPVSPLLAGLAPGAYSRGAGAAMPQSQPPMQPTTPHQRAHAAGNSVIDDMITPQSSLMDELPSNAALNQEYRPVNGRAWGGGPNYMRRVR